MTSLAGAGLGQSQISRVGSKQEHRPPFAAFPGKLTGSWITSGPTRTWTSAPGWVAGVTGCSLTHCTTMPAPNNSVLTGHLWCHRMTVPHARVLFDGKEPLPCLSPLQAQEGKRQHCKRSSRPASSTSDPPPKNTIKNLKSTTDYNWIILKIPRRRQAVQNLVINTTLLTGLFEGYASLTPCIARYRS